MLELTKREAQVLELRTSGLKNREVADKLGISNDTVKFYVKQLIMKGAMEPRPRTHERIDGVAVVKIFMSRALTPDQKLDQIRMLFFDQGDGSTYDWAVELIRKDDEARQKRIKQLDQGGQ